MGGGDGVGRAADVRIKGGGAAIGVGEDEVGRSPAGRGFFFFFIVLKCFVKENKVLAFIIFCVSFRF